MLQMTTLNGSPVSLGLLYQWPNKNLRAVKMGFLVTLCMSYDKVTGWRWCYYHLAEYRIQVISNLPRKVGKCGQVIYYHASTIFFDFDCPEIKLL